MVAMQKTASPSLFLMPVTCNTLHDAQDSLVLLFFAPCSLLVSSQIGFATSLASPVSLLILHG